MKSPAIYAWLVFGAMTGGALCAQEPAPAATAAAATTTAVPVVPANGAPALDIGHQC